MKAKLLKNQSYVRVRNFWLFSMKTVNFAICKIVEQFFLKTWDKAQMLSEFDIWTFLGFAIFLQTINWCYESV